VGLVEASPICKFAGGGGGGGVNSDDSKKVQSSFLFLFYGCIVHNPLPVSRGEANWRGLEWNMILALSTGRGDIERMKER
jgi:hypothetical protein